MLFKSLFLSAAGTVTDTAFTFTPENFISNLYYMGIGMLAIFVVITAIISLVCALDVLVRAFTKQ